MSRKYERKTLRASWSAADLDEAMRNVRNKEMGVNEASRNFGIPSRTLRRHLLSSNSKGPLGRRPVFSREYEKKLVAHIKKLEKVGFAPDRKDVKEMAFQLANKFNIKNPFSEIVESAGNVWFSGFMVRNPELSQRKSEGLSLSRAYGVNRKDVQEFFDLLAKIYKENDFVNHPEDIFNMDESGIQVNNKPGKVVATKGAKDVYTLTSNEKGENVTVIACVNAQGNFIPPVLIYKGTYIKPQFSEGLPPGSQVFMNKKSSYINSDLFMKWFEDVFLRHKSPRKTLLILDGHSSHSNNIRLLEVAKENDVILLCLPSHTTHALQPLDRAFFRPLKLYFAQEAKAFMVRNKDKKFTRYDVSKLIGRAWGKAATISNGVSALKSCGIYPFDPSAIPDHYFALSDSLLDQNLVEHVQDEEDQTSRESLSLLLGHDFNALPENNFLTRMTAHSSTQYVEPEIRPSRESPRELHPENTFVTTATIHSPSRRINRHEPRSIGMNPTTSHIKEVPLMTVATVQSSRELVTESEPQLSIDPKTTKKHPQQCRNQLEFSQESSGQSTIKANAMDFIEKTPEKNIGSTEPQETPSKILNALHPVPKLPVVFSNRKQKAVVLTSVENIEKRKLLDVKKKPKVQSVKYKQTKSTKRNVTTRKKTKTTEEYDGDRIRKDNMGGKKLRKGPVRNKKKKKLSSSSSSESRDDNKDNIDISEEEISDEDNNRCAECTEDYYQTQSSEDWIQCTSCLAWLHEFCTMYNPLCNICGRKAKREAVKK